MAVNSVSIQQDNVAFGSNLMPVHSPLVFLVDLSYDGKTPDVLFVDIEADSEIVDSFRCVYFSDPLASIRRFSFNASSVIRGLMDGFNDFQQLNNTLVYVEGITKLITLRFYDEDDTFSDSVIIDTVHGAAQFGNNPNLFSIFKNDPSVYFGPKDGFTYIYFYNDDPSNTLTIDSPNFNFDFAQDYDSSIFEDYNTSQFQIKII